MQYCDGPMGSSGFHEALFKPLLSDVIYRADAERCRSLRNEHRVLRSLQDQHTRLDFLMISFDILEGNFAIE